LAIVPSVFTSAWAICRLVIPRVTATVDEQPERATVRATLRVAPGEEHEIELPLVNEEGFWRVASLVPLARLSR
jgi:hypothetical protein